MNRVNKPSDIDVLELETFRLPSPLWSPVQELRYEVFVLEQGVPVEIEQDDADQEATHLVASLDGRTVATLRILVSEGYAKIGRVAVAEPYRRRGIGRRILAGAIRHCHLQEIEKISLNAQVQSRALYESLGFVASGSIFQEAGIDHIKMDLWLDSA